MLAPALGPSWTYSALNQPSVSEAKAEVNYKAGKFGVLRKVIGGEYALEGKFNMLALMCALESFPVLASAVLLS